MNFFPNVETHFLLPAKAGNLEVIASPANFDSPKKSIGIVCHPHPLHGGTMNNKVVMTLVRTFRDLGLATIRFNFRGVGKSEGSFAEGLGEIQDLLAIVEWTKKVCPEHDLWLGGFSFGAFIAASVATQISVKQLVTIAPQVSRFIETQLSPITCPWILVQGDKDEIVNPLEVYAWIDTLEIKPTLIKMPEAGHFFHGKLLELREKLVAELT